MPARRIITYPNPILRRESDAWNFNADVDNSRKLESIAQDMLETLEKVDHGAALAAPQIGESLQLVCFNIEKANSDLVNMPLFAVNPHIIEFSKETETMNEGCLSFPSKWAPISRPRSVSVEWFDLWGERFEGHYVGFWARCWQHEIDHLNGKLFLDLMDRKTKFRIKGEMRA